MFIEQFTSSVKGPSFEGQPLWVIHVYLSATQVKKEKRYVYESFKSRLTYYWRGFDWIWLACAGGSALQRLRFLGSDLAVFHRRRWRIVLCGNVQWRKIGGRFGNSRLRPNCGWVNAVLAKSVRSLGKLGVWLDCDPHSSWNRHLYYGSIHGKPGSTRERTEPA